MEGIPINLHGLRFCTHLLLALAVGCAAPRAVPPLDVDHPSADSAAAALRPELRGILAEVIRPQEVLDHPSSAAGRNLLVLSGGGKLGAYSAGILSGWTARGTRPPFDVVSGISTGALIAPFAFLGLRYDRIRADNYTTVRTENIYRRRPYLAMLWSESLADSAPLRRRIDEQITDDFLAEIAQAHITGRRLYVGTTNLDTGRLVPWDLGAIAAGTDPDKLALFRKVLLASCSIPGLLPPVPIEIEVDGQRYTELNVDGGISASMFLHPYMILGNHTGVETNIYVIVAGKLSLELRRVESRFIAVSGEALQELLNTQTRSDLLQTFLLTRLTGGRFAIASVPPELPVSQDGTRFNTEEMRRLFDAGYERASSGAAWLSTPPGVSPGEWSRPRTGIRFNTPASNP
jgi:predicted acylesterase/phospholipase RssA